MSEPEQNQQAEVVQVDHHQAESGAPTHTSQIKEEGTVALEISQLAQSVSSGHHSQIHSQEITVETVEPKEIVETKSEGQKVEQTVVLVTSAIQSDSGSVVLQEQKKQVKVESKVNEGDEPQSPINYRNSDKLVLSPRSSSKRSTSPAINKGKLDIVVKMLLKEEDKGRDLEDQLNQLTFKKLEVQKALNEKILTQKSFKQRQEEEEEKLNQERGRLNSAVAEKQAFLAHLRQTKDQEEALHTAEISKIHQENARLQYQLQNKKKSEQQQQQEHQAALANARSAFQAEQKRLAHIQESHAAALGQKQAIAKKIADLNGQKQVVQANVANAKNSAAEKAQAEQQAKADLLKKIADVKEKINNKKIELTQVKGQNHDDLKNELQKVSQEVQSARNASHNLIQSNKQLEEQISKKSKEATENKEAEKKKEKRIIDLSKRSEQLSKKLNDLKEESAKLDTQKQEKKAVRYEEKVPEEFLAVQAKNEAIRKEIKKVTEKYDFERSELDKLVPPSVIENMNKKISAVISNNQRSTEIVKIIEQVTKENEKLGVEIDSLEWGENNYLKDLEYQRKKQDEKNKALEEELQTKKKQLQQLTFKLDEYVKQYPDFKPEKKKKPEPQPEPKAKKEEKGKKSDKSPPAEELKKKKSAGVEVPQPKVEQVKVDKVVEVKAEEPKAGKNKKKKGSASEIIEIKADSPPAIEVKVQVKPEKNKVEVKPEVRSEIKAEPKAEPKAEQKVEAKQGENKPKKKKK